MSKKYLCLDIDQTLVSGIGALLDILRYDQISGKTPLEGNFQLITHMLPDSNEHFHDYIAINPQEISKILLACRQNNIEIIFVTGASYLKDDILPVLARTYQLSEDFFAESIFINRDDIDHEERWSKGLVIHKLRGNKIPIDADITLLDDLGVHYASCAQHNIKFIHANGFNFNLPKSDRNDYLQRISNHFKLELDFSQEVSKSINIAPLLNFMHSVRVAIQNAIICIGSQLMTIPEKNWIYQMIFGMLAQNASNLNYVIPADFFSNMKQIIMPYIKINDSHEPEITDESECFNKIQEMFKAVLATATQPKPSEAAPEEAANIQESADKKRVRLSCA